MPHTPVDAGYAGGVTWTDIQIGKVLDALDATGEADNTLVMYWADHGWALGEQAMFCKMANFELQTRVPMARSRHNGRFSRIFHFTSFHNFHDLSACYIACCVRPLWLALPRCATTAARSATSLTTYLTLRFFLPPQLIRAPWLKTSGSTTAMVELVDMSRPRLKDTPSESFWGAALGTLLYEI